MRSLAILVLLTTSARAELRMDSELGAGAEAGTIAESRPALVGEAGLTVSYRPGDSVFGIAADLLAIGREQMPYGADNELRSDLMLLVADPEGRGRLTVGPGIRDLSIMPPEAVYAKNIHGYDFVHLGVTVRLVGWDAPPVGKIELDARGSFTFGCYHGELMEHAVNCTSTVSTTYVAGVGFAFSL